MDKLRMQTANKADENFRKLAAMFPNAVTETITGYDANGKAIVDRAIDKDVLMQEISCTVVDGNEERYQFTWPDKKKSVLLANAPINKTLRPCREESVDFDTTENLYIEGDNLEVLKLLQETYLHRVKMIYIDPPYNTGFNLIYHNDFHQKTQDYLANSGQQDENGNALVGNPETNGRFHTDWLNMMYPRLRLAKDLLTNDGVLCCAIDENEFATLSQMLKEIFGESSYEHSYVSVVHNPRGQQGNNFSYVNEYLIFIYPADNKKYLADFPKETVDARNLRDSGTESDRTDARNCFYPFIVRSGKIIDIGDVPENNFHPSSANVIRGDGTIEVWPMNDDGDEKKWRYARQSVEKILSQLEPKEGRNSVQIMNEYEIERVDSFTGEKTRTQTLKHAEASQIKYDLIGKIAEGTVLTRRTVSAILQGIRVDKLYMFRNNPEEFISKVIRLINEQKATMIVEHISYDTIEGEYDSSIFTAEKATQSFDKAFLAKKAIQDYVFTDGSADKSIERKFAEDLDAAEEVCVYAKLPRTFQIPTPVGNYSPDWAIAFYEGTVKHIFFIAETKGTMESLELRPIEQAKISCAKKLFNEMSTSNVVYHDVDSYRSLLSIMSYIA